MYLTRLLYLALFQPVVLVAFSYMIPSLLSFPKDDGVRFFSRLSEKSPIQLPTKDSQG